MSNDCEIKINTPRNTHQCWLNWRLQSTSYYVRPMHVLEERMRSNRLSIVGTRTQSLRNLSLHQSTDQVSSFRCQITWQIQFALQNGLNSLLSVLRRERRQARQHVVH